MRRTQMEPHWPETLQGTVWGFANLVTPETTSDGQDGQLGQDDGAADGGGDFLGALDAQSNVAVVIADGDESLEPGALTGTGLLLYRHDLQDLILELRSQKGIDDLGFFDGEREKGRSLPRT